MVEARIFPASLTRFPPTPTSSSRFGQFTRENLARVFDQQGSNGIGAQVFLNPRESGGDARAVCRSVNVAGDCVSQATLQQQPSRTHLGLAVSAINGCEVDE